MFFKRLAYRRVVSSVASKLHYLRSTSPTNTHEAVLREEFVFPSAPFAMAHASTIAQTGRGLIAAWFGGSLESRPDVSIWLCRHETDGWSAPVEVANGTQADGARYACWNPVLFQPSNGPLTLFYKVGPSPKSWWGMRIRSSDGGYTWSPPRRLPDGILGPIKNKPIQLPDGTLLSPSSMEHHGWRIHLERSVDAGETWESSGPINDGQKIVAIQPSILVYPDDRLQLLCRSKQRRIAESWSTDGGASWSEMTLTGLPNPNSGTDAVTLSDGRQLLVYNHSTRNRSPLNVAISEDGKSWITCLVPETARLGEFSYPAVIQTSDGLVHVTYTWLLRRIKHVVLDPGRLG